MNCDPMSEALTETTEDAFLGGQLRLRQPRSGHRSGHDAMLLAAAVAARPGDRVVEFGAGVGAAGLALAKRVGRIELTLVEIDPQLAALARDNASANGIAADVAVLDVTSAAEAFAAQGLAVLRLLGLKDDDARVNINGGAIALGHPLGASGARLATTAVNQLHKGGGRYALCTMCIGVGQGIAVILERV